MDHVTCVFGHDVATEQLAGLGIGHTLDVAVLEAVDLCFLCLDEPREAGANPARRVRTGFARLIEAEKAQIDGLEHGHVKCVADAKTGELLGCHIVSENAGDMIHEAVAMMAARTPVKVVAKAMHAYPTLSELMRSALREAGG